MPEFPKEISMLTEKTIRAPFISACLLATLSLLSSVAYTQKGMQTTQGTPLKGVDVKLGKNPGGTAAARTIHTDKDGKIDLGVLPKGSWYLVVVVPESDAAAAQSDDIYLVTVTGPVGSETKWEWSLKPPADGSVARKLGGQLSEIRNQRGAKPVAQETITFETAGPTPCFATIIRSKSKTYGDRQQTKP